MIKIGALFEITQEYLDFYAKDRGMRSFFHLGDLVIVKKKQRHELDIYVHQVRGSVSSWVPSKLLRKI